MNVFSAATKALLIALLMAGSSTAASEVHHALQVTLAPDQHALFVVDKVTLPKDHQGPVRFWLHAGLKPRVVETGLPLEPKPVAQKSGVRPPEPQVPLQQFRVPLPPGSHTFTLEYGGEIYHAIAPLAEAYARSFATSPGLISEEGVFLAGSSYWYPRFNDEQVTFTLDINLPSGWRAVSQGKRTRHVDGADNSREAWVTESPQEEMYLLAGELTEYQDSTEAVGYGKTLMLFHMLRQQLGDTTFIQGLRELYRHRLFKGTDFRQVLESFAAAAGKPLNQFFQQWVERTGAPALRVLATRSTREPTGYRLTAELEQVQPGPAYQLQIPIAVHLEGEDLAYQTRIAMERKRMTLDRVLPSRPVGLDIDPEFDLFRRLHRDEIPPALRGCE